MNGFIDFHCHVLPGIDDGAQSMEETMTMLHQAVRSGISEVIVTPHHHVYRGMPTPEKIRSVLSEVQECVTEEGLELQLHPGNELYYAHDIIDKLDHGEVLTLADSKYVLVEFSGSVAYPELRQGLMGLQQAGYYPVLAHVERYGCMTEDVDLTGELYDMGVYIQVNAGSFLGDAGRRPKKFVSRLLKEEMVHFVGTDAHDPKLRNMELESTVKFLRRKTGEETMWRLLRDNALAVLHKQVL